MVFLRPGGAAKRLLLSVAPARSRSSDAPAEQRCGAAFIRCPGRAASLFSCDLAAEPCATGRTRRWADPRAAIHRGLCRTPSGSCARLSTSVRRSPTAEGLWAHDNDPAGPGQLIRLPAGTGALQIAWPCGQGWTPVGAVARPPGPSSPLSADVGSTPEPAALTSCLAGGPDLSAGCFGDESTQPAADVLTSRGGRCP